MFSQVKPPQKRFVRKQTSCYRSGCDKILTPEMGVEEYRSIGRLIPVCRSCYQEIWEFKKKHKLESMEDAYKALPAPALELDKSINIVQCAMAWCSNDVFKKNRYLLKRDKYVCGKCKRYFHALVRRQKSKNDWLWFAAKAIEGNIPPPDAPEVCGAQWCESIISKPCRRNHNGQALCNTDAAYFFTYARRKGITFVEACMTAPPPRLLHTRN